MIHGFAMAAWAVFTSSATKISGRKPKPEDFMPRKSQDDGFFTMEQAETISKAENAHGSKRKTVKQRKTSRKK